MHQLSQLQSTADLSKSRYMVILHSPLCPPWRRVVADLRAVSGVLGAGAEMSGSYWDNLAAEYATCGQYHAAASLGSNARGELRQRRTRRKGASGELRVPGYLPTRCAHNHPVAFNELRAPIFSAVMEEMQSQSPVIFLASY